MFYPKANVTREEFVKILLSALKIEVSSEKAYSFDDAAYNSWYYPYVQTAYRLEIIKGKTPTDFGAGLAITREEMAVMLARAAEILGIQLKETEHFYFSDPISEYARDSVEKLASAGIINGLANGTLAGGSNATREMAATVIYKAAMLYWEK